MFQRLSLILKSSAKITLEPENRKARLSPLKYGSVQGRIAYFVMAMLNAKDVVFMKRDTVNRFRLLMERHPEAIPSIFWPYQCKHWNTSERVEHLYSHFQTLPRLPYEIDCQANHERILAEADDVYPGLRIVIDKNGLFMREGMLTLNTFVGHERMFTIAFSFSSDDSGQVCALVGAIQGRRMPHIEALYRDMTRVTHGVRPRDMMVEVFQIFCRWVGVERIYAIADSHRQHKHYFYFLKNKRDSLHLDYDEVWADRGGRRCSEAFFELSTRPVFRPLEKIVSKKRSMYRKRYAMLNRLEQRLKSGLHTFARDKQLAAPQRVRSTG
ncbi:MAG: DUF535 family protein [Candidatus Thiodiazotropha sp.]